MKRKLLVSALILSMILTFMPSAVFGGEGEFNPTPLTEIGMSGWCGGDTSKQKTTYSYGEGQEQTVYSNVSWELISNGSGSDGSETYTLTISGSGPMADIASAGVAPWCIALPDNAYQTQITKIVIGKNITVVGNNAFVWCKGVRSVEFEKGSVLEEIRENGFHSLFAMENITFPETLQVIGGAAFYDCRVLENVSFANPNELTYIGGSAFGACGSLTYFNSEQEGVFNIPENVTEVGAKAFQKNLAMQEVRIPAGTEKLQGAFYGCKSLKQVDFAEGSRLSCLEEDGNVGVFFDTAIEYIELPVGLEKIGNLTFADSSLKEIIIPKGVTEIGDSAFQNCTALTKVTFEENSELKKIGTGAFGGDTSLTELRIPEGVEVVGDSILHNSNLNGGFLQLPSTLKEGFKIGYLQGIGSTTLDASRTLVEIIPHTTTAFKIVYVEDAERAAETCFFHYGTFAVTNGGILHGAHEDGFLMIPEKKGAVFSGWYEDKSFTTPVNDVEGKFPYTTGLANNKKFYYAKWKLEAPVVEVTADKTHITTGDTAVLTAKIEEPKEGVVYSYQWYKEDTQIDGATESTYNTKEEGTYYCKVIATDTEGFASDPVTSDGLEISISQNDSEITIENQKTKAVYGEEPFSFTYTATEGITPIVSSSDQSVAVVEKGEENKVTVTVVGAGETTISVEFEGNDTYASASASFELAVEKADLEVKANDITVSVGDKMPNFDYMVTGLKGGDNEEEIKEVIGSVDLTCTAQNTNTAGTYPITVSGPKEIDNYKIAYVNGTLTVSEKSSGGGIIIPPSGDHVVHNPSSDTTTADINVSVSADGTAKVTVSEALADKIVTNAVRNQAEEVVLDATTYGSRAKAAEVKFPAEAIKELLYETYAELTVKTDAATLHLDRETMQQISEKAESGSITFSIEKEKEETNAVYLDLHITAEQGEVTDFGSGTAEITVKLPYTLYDKEVTAVYIDDKGVYEKIGGVKNKDNTFTFTTDHFSSYAVMETAEADKIIKEQTDEKNQRLIKGVENTTIKLSYKKNEIGKGWIKLRYKKSYGYKVDNYEVFRSAKKKTNFGRKAWFVTKTNKTSGYYKNGKSVKKGTRYYYKMRGVREIAGETYYTKWSNTVMRTGR